MPKAKEKSSDGNTELIRTLIIVQLGLAGISQQSIRSIAGCDMNRVNKILKQLNLKKKAQKKE